ncbi:pheST operon leader peptide PheM [Serratia sp. UGAL515B_01]|nr:pheST operon leader peptide PheM [Serratia sp. UGAL515B_01]WON78933.1 pheST operon leader peptide PheM [Serratia sp. UGAL515B_01]
MHAAISRFFFYFSA